MPSMTLIVPGSLATRTGGYEYDRRMVAGLRDRGWSVDIRELSASFPTPTDSALRQTSDVLTAIPSGTIVVIDGLAAGAIPDHVERERTRLRIVALVHLPLAEEIGIEPTKATRLK